MQGRWSLTAGLFADAPAHGPRMRALAEVLLERYGIVTRETVLAEGMPGGFAGLYGELANLETLGTARRGYFVEGLGGAQFALPAAIERLRGLRADEPAGAHVLAATDPANPYGATLPWPRRDDESARRPSRVAGAYVVTLDAEPVLYVERGGKGLLPLREPEESWLRPALEALAEAVRRGHVARLGVERFDGEPVVGSPAGALHGLGHDGGGELLKAADEISGELAVARVRACRSAGQDGADEIEDAGVRDRAAFSGERHRPVDVAAVLAAHAVHGRVGAVDRKRRDDLDQRPAQAVQREVAVAAVGLGDAIQRVGRARSARSPARRS